MLGSIRIGSVFGIQFRIHWLFVVLVLFVVYSYSRLGVHPALSFGFLVMLSGIVLLHELGHSLVARRFGIRVLDITLWPLGGMARMSEIPENFKVEGLIAIAGPAVNLVLAFLALPVWLWSVMQGADPGTLIGTVELASGYFILINLTLGVFNLIPAFPMDGGRVLRAFLGRKGDWVGATATAVKVGKVFAILMIGLGLVPGVGITVLPLIGLFVWFAGNRELRAVRMRHRGPFDPLANLFGGAFRFGPNGPEPVARPATVEPPPHQAEAASPPSGYGADPSGARRPATPEVLGGSRRRRAFTPEEIEELERFRGSMRRDPE